MKSTLALFMALFIWMHAVLPGLSVVELGKLPALFHHYQKHRQLSNELSFVSFLEMHYADASHHNQDQKEHHKLPFADHQSTISISGVYFVGERHYCQAIKRTPIGKTNQSVYQSIVEEDIATMVWQPPRLA